MRRFTERQERYWNQIWTVLTAVMFLFIEGGFIYFGIEALGDGPSVTGIFLPVSAAWNLVWMPRVIRLGWNWEPGSRSK